MVANRFFNPDEIIRIRKQKGLTQTQLAQLIYSTRQHVHRIETGLGSPSFETALRIAKALGIKMEDMSR